MHSALGATPVHRQRMMDAVNSNAKRNGIRGGYGVTPGGGAGIGSVRARSGFNSASSTKGNRTVADRDATPYNTSMYLVPPTGPVNVEDLESWSLNRMNVLKAVASAKISNEEVAEKIQKAVYEHDMRIAHQRPNGSVNADSSAPTAHDMHAFKDRVSHWFLRTAFARNEVTQRWFLAQERELFMWRFSQESSAAKESFLADYGLEYTRVQDNEYKELAPFLDALFTGGKNEDKTRYFKVPWTEALDLIARRSVHVNDGFAYVPEYQIVRIVASRFRGFLSKSLKTAQRMLGPIREDERLPHLLDALTQEFMRSEYKSKASAGQVTPDQLDDLAKTSMPLCMSACHKKLRGSHHLKYHGRLQYGLFLKGIGLSVEDAIVFWRAELSQSHVGPDRFDKEYLYSIRHNYGLVGGRKDYKPQPCLKVISATPGPDDVHGCPFALYDSENLSRSLSAAGVAMADQEDILRLAASKRPQEACRKHFESLYGRPGAVGNHPNEWFDSAQRAQGRSTTTDSTAEGGAEPMVEDSVEHGGAAARAATDGAAPATSSSSALNADNIPTEEEMMELM